MENNFNIIWAALVENGSSPRNMEATRSYWITLDEAQQQQLITIITLKLQQGRFIHYDPIRALKENLRRCKVVEPPFLRGDEPGDLVQVRYNGLYKICTRDTMQKYGLEYVKDWKAYVA